MTPRQFKSIVFFNPATFPELIREKFRNYRIVNTFETSAVEELEQILLQSEQTAIVISVKEALQLLKFIGRFLGSSRFRVYYLNSNDPCSLADIEDLARQNISVILESKPENVVKKIEFYFFGKVELFRPREAQTGLEVERIEEREATGVRRSYFSLFEEKGNFWEIVASTHESEDLIETMLGRSWTVWYLTILKENPGPGLSVDYEFSKEFVALVRFIGIKKMACIHLSKTDPNFAESLLKAKKFLNAI